jgi:hypothetical protein
MKSKFVSALVIAALGSLMGASLADAHYLDGGTAYRVASRDTRNTAQEIANRSGKTVSWSVRNPCSQRTAHRWVCDAAMWVSNGGGRRVCTAKVIVQFASRTSYALRTKAVGFSCRNE